MVLTTDQNDSIGYDNIETLYQAIKDRPQGIYNRGIGHVEAIESDPENSQISDLRSHSELNIAWQAASVLLSTGK